MSNFYVVSKASADAAGYESATVFNNTNEDYDNEAAANEYRDECAVLRPWQSHEVVSADDFASKYETDDAEADADAQTD